MPEKIELSLVWSFTCRNCKHVNYHHGTSRGITAEAREEAAAALGDGDLVSIPERVWCAKCEAVFDVAIPDDT